MNAIIPIEEIAAFGNPSNKWLALYFYTYFLLEEGADYKEINNAFPDFIERHISEIQESTGYYLNPRLQPLTEIWLNSPSEIVAVRKPTGSMQTLTILASVGILIILIASINFINLSTARSTKRANEVGVRKSFGAFRGQLVSQFFIESVLTATIALLIGVAIAYFSTPWFDQLMPGELSFNIFSNISGLLGVLGIFTVVILLSGTIPATTYSAINPVDVLKRQMTKGRKGRNLRRIFVVLQFSISIFLIIGTVTIFKQMNYMMNKDLGFEKDQVLQFDVPNQEIMMQLDEIKLRLMENPIITSASYSSNAPGRGHPIRIFLPEGYDDNEVMEAGLTIVDYDFAETFGLEMAQGRFFSEDVPSDTFAYIINESLARKLNAEKPDWEDPIGKTFDFPPRPSIPGTVIGVVKDFHMNSLHREIYPLVLNMVAEAPRVVSIKFSAGETAEVIKYTETVFKEFAPQFPFEYEFLDENFEAGYERDENFGKLFGTFAFLAIFIALLGLLGLTTYLAEARIKEIGIRKVLGATAGQVVFMLSKDILRWVILANVIAWPSAYFALKHWLQNYAYRIDPASIAFVYVGVVVLAISLLTISGISYRAANTNPVKSLHNE